MNHACVWHAQVYADGRPLSERHPVVILLERFGDGVLIRNLEAVEIPMVEPVVADRLQVCFYDGEDLRWTEHIDAYGQVVSGVNLRGGLTPPQSPGSARWLDERRN